ncbi:MAG: histidine phosphatase family protein [Pseudomonadota bacterium]|nr:histidine phosphatase family protein [Pseudomonadota bacterium]
MTRLHLVRHGPTHARAMVGWSDIPADLGDSAALSRLSTALPERAIVVSSDLIRASATADAIQGTRRRLPHDPALRELHFGDWEMQTARQIGASHPTLSRAYWETPGDIAPPNGESWNQARARIDAAIDRLCADHAGGDIVIVAHFGMILTQVQRARGQTPYQALGQKIDNLSLTQLERTASGWRVGAINHRP